MIAALLLLTSWPLPDDRNVSFCLGVALLAAGAMLMRGALQLRRLPPGTRVGQLGLLQSSPMAEPPSALADAVQPAGPRAALEGSFADKPFWPTLLRLLFTIDLWHAGRVRVRADALAWTPGFVQDYASALRRITYPRDQRRLRRRRRSARGRKADAAVGSLA